MNHIYKLKFDKRRNEIVVVSEITTGPGKVHTSRGAEKNVVSMVKNLTRSALSVLILAGLGSPGMAAGLPAGGQVVAGSASIQKPSANQMNIHQNSQHAVLNWNSFDIGQGHTVQFYQPNSSSVALNRVVGGNESHIMGNLNANGRVFLVNPNGVLFGKGVSVNTAGLVATTRDVKNEDFMNGKYVFSGRKGQGEVVNQGSLATTEGGFIVLAGDRVKNSGTLRTPGGRTVLAAVENVTLQLDNAGLTSVSVNGSVVNSLVENSGLVSARDGQVWLTARGKNTLMNTVLNNSGVVEARGLSVKDGNIVLDGGDSGVVRHSGTLLADNDHGRGGKVVVEGQHILLDEHSRITATGSQGGGEVYVGGGWQGKDIGIRHAQKVVMLKGADIDVSATGKGNGGTAVLWSDEYTNFRGNIRAKGGATAGNGGRVETSSHNNLQAFGQVDASAARGRGGEWLLDPADITIVDNGNNTNVTNSTTNSTSLFSPTDTATTGQVGVTNINNLLNNGTSVNITTNNSAVGNGCITVNAVINKTQGGNASLTLFADGNITVNQNITSTAGALNISLLGANSRDGAVNISNSNITTNNGSLTIRHGNGHNMTIAITNASLSAATDVTLNGTSVTLNGTSVTSQSGNVNITGNGERTGVTLINSSITSENNITITGVTSSTESWNGYSTIAGVTLEGNDTLKGRNIAISGRSVNDTIPDNAKYDPGAAGIIFKYGDNYSFDGNVSIRGESQSHHGVVFIPRVGQLNMNITFANGSSSIEGRIASNHGVTITSVDSGAISLGTWYDNESVNFRVNHSNLTITADSSNVKNVAINAFAAVSAGGESYTNHRTNGYTFSGDGNVSVVGIANKGNGLEARLFNNQGLKGHLILNGTSESGNGITMNNYLNSTLVNATVIGNSGSGVGVDIIALEQTSSLDFNGNKITGTTRSGKAGVNIAGTNIKLTNGTLSGSASGNTGAGIALSGTGNYSVSGVDVRGTSVDGTGISVNGSLTVGQNAALSGTSTGNGTGVQIDGNLAGTGGASITGTAGSGSGVSIQGNTSLGNITVTGNTQTGT
ncbi:filamentous hemagglutinin N-terminal domain-containing protein, partial [Escherichia coli]|nr:filamentous hemagglutinin N-terminal domain-containing protein [Escherichia coli]